MSDYTIDNVINDIQNLQDQNSYDFQEIKRLDGLIKDYDKRVLQAINMNNQINEKIQDDYENIKKIIIDENVSITLDKKIDENTNKITDVSSQLNTNVQHLTNKINEVATTGTTTEVIQNKVSELAQSGIITFDTVKPEMTTFMDRHINLYDNKTINDLSINTSGTNYPSTGDYASNYIDITSDTNLYIKSIKRVAFYKTDNTLIKVGGANETNLTKVAIPDETVKIRYSVSGEKKAEAFICIVNEEICDAEYGNKLPFNYLSKNEFRNNLLSFSNEIQITKNNCDFFNNPINIYDNKTINNLGLNTSSTIYPLTGGYVSDYLNVDNNKYIYGYKCNRLIIRDINDNVLLNTTISNFEKIEIPTDGVKFKYSIKPENITIAKIYLTDFEISENPPLSKLKNEYLNMEYIINNIKNNRLNKIIACYGDSLTEGAGTTNAGVYSYPSRLQGLINEKAEVPFNVYNRGIGGNTSTAILTKSGCYADMVNPFTIPSDTTPVAITKTGSLANNVGGTISIRNGVNPVTIGGIKGTLSYSDGTYKFARLEAGDEVKITRPTQILPSAKFTDTGAILCICVGTNDSDKGEVEYPKKLIQRIRRMIEYLGSTQYIIIGLTVTNKDYINSELEKEFGANFFDVYKYLINYGLEDNVLTATSEDLEDIQNGLIPRQIRKDDVHYNNYGYYSKAMGIYLKGKDLGYWE